MKNGAATAVDLAGHVTGYGWSTTVRGGLSAMGDLTGGTVKVYPNTTPAIFGDRYLTYLAAKKAMAIHMGAPNPQFRQDNATALVRGDEYLRSSMRPEFGDRFHLPLPYKGATEVRIKRDGNIIYVRVVETGLDISLFLVNHANPENYFKSEIFFDSYFAISPTGVMLGETWAPQFIGGARPVALYIEKAPVTASDQGLVDFFRGFALRQPKMQLVTAAYSNANICDAEPYSTFCRMTKDDQDLVGKTLWNGGLPEIKSLLVGLDPSIVAQIDSGSSVPRKPVKKELSW